MQRQQRNDQPVDEISGHYPTDQLADPDLPEISAERVQSILSSAVLVLTCVVALALPTIVLLDWFGR